MKTANVVVVGIAAALGVSAAACGGSSNPKFPLTGSRATPAAMGHVQVSVGPNENTRLDINVDHLAPASLVAPNATTYVAWIVPSPGQQSAGQMGSAPINAGAIQVQPDLSGKLSTVTPFENFRVIITPEPSATTSAPSNRPVLTAMVRP